MTPEQLRELIESLRNGSPLPTDDAIALAIAHAAALEELARVKRAIAESCDEQRGEYFGCRRAERAEAALAECRAKLEVDPRTKYDGIDCRDETIRMLEERLAESERKCERLKFHAEAMADCVRVMLDSDIGAKWIWPSSAKESATQHMTESLSAYRAEFKEAK